MTDWQPARQGKCSGRATRVHATASAWVVKLYDSAWKGVAGYSDSVAGLKRIVSALPKRRSVVMGTSELAIAGVKDRLLAALEPSAYGHSNSH